MTGAELARRLEVDRATIWRWEAGRQTPESADLIQAFADLFGLDVEDALRVAGLRPSTDHAAPPPEREPLDPEVVKLLRLLANPDTPDHTKEQIRAMMRALADLADAQPPRPPRTRRAAG